MLLGYPLAVLASTTRACGSCDAGTACGLCLMLVEQSECPSGRNDSQGRAFAIANDCRRLKVGDMCEADGECRRGGVSNPTALNPEGQEQPSSLT